MKIKQIILIILIFCVFNTQTISASHTSNYPNSFTTFRDTVYMQNSCLSETMRLYTTAKQEIEISYSGVDKYLLLSRCEYLMGLTLLEEIMQQNYSNLDWEDQFNIFLMLQAACLKLNRNHEAQIWRAGGEAIYQSNNFIRFLVE